MYVKIILLCHLEYLEEQIYLKKFTIKISKKKVEKNKENGLSNIIFGLIKAISLNSLIEGLPLVMYAPRGRGGGGGGSSILYISIAYHMQKGTDDAHIIPCMHSQNIVSSLHSVHSTAKWDEGPDLWDDPFPYHIVYQHIELFFQQLL